MIHFFCRYDSAWTLQDCSKKPWACMASSLQNRPTIISVSVSSGHKKLVCIHTSAVCALTTTALTKNCEEWSDETSNEHFHQWTSFDRKLDRRNCRACCVPWQKAPKGSWGIARSDSIHSSLAATTLVYNKQLVGYELCGSDIVVGWTRRVCVLAFDGLDWKAWVATVVDSWTTRFASLRLSIGSIALVLAAILHYLCWILRRTLFNVLSHS